MATTDTSSDKSKDKDAEDKKEKVYFKHVNLYDIPRGIVPQQVYDMAEAMREDNLQEWKHVIMGEVGDPATMVFPNLSPVRERDVDWSDERNWALANPSMWRAFCGIDYGYRPDPTAAVIVLYNRALKILWIIGECYGVGWSEEGIYDQVTSMIEKTASTTLCKRVDPTGVINKNMVINSEIDNRIIDGLRRRGLNIYPVKKFSGSRDISYQFLTGGYGDVKGIWIDSERCPNAWAEFSGAEFPRREINGKDIIVQEWPRRTVIILWMPHAIGTIDLWAGRAVTGSSSRFL